MVNKGFLILFNYFITNTFLKLINLYPQFIIMLASDGIKKRLALALALGKVHKINKYTYRFLLNVLFFYKVEFGLDWIIKFAIRKNKKVWLSGIYQYYNT